MKLCRKCGAKEGSDNCCKNGSLQKKVAVSKAPRKPRRQSPIQTEITTSEVSE